MRLAAILLATLPLAAQEPTFDVQSRLVLVPVTLFDRKGQFIDTLTAADFTLLDKGHKQRVTVDTTGTGVAPIALIIAVQASGISVPVLQKVQKIGSMIEPLITGERGCAGLVAFSEEVEWKQDCTHDLDALAIAMRKIQPGDQTKGRMLDAVAESIKRLSAIPNVRRVLLLISEKRDRGSEMSLENAVLRAQAAGVSIYAATYSPFKTAFTTKERKGPTPARSLEDPRKPGKTLPADDRVPLPSADSSVDLLGAMRELGRLNHEKVTEVLSDATGGTTFPFVRQKALEEAIASFGAELNRQYILSFTPDDPSNGYHDIEVRIRSSEMMRIRSRPGYWSGPIPDEKKPAAK